MLDELKNLNYQGGKEGLLFFLSDVIGTGQIKISDAVVLCSHAPGKRYLVVESLISYCAAFGWIEIFKDTISVSPTLITLLNDKAKLNDALITSTVNRMFKENLMNLDMFCYDSVQFRYAFKNELLPLSLSAVRNVLISQGFLIPLRDPRGARFYISPTYDVLVAKHCKESRRQLSLEQLKKQLERNEESGERAEIFVFEYERKRLGAPLSEKVRRISEIDVRAGYDIISFDSFQSQEADGFIEVKAVSDAGFYWSKNEYEIAKLYGEKYCLYLVELSRIADEGYTPKIILNPALAVMSSCDWFVEPESYHVQKAIGM